MSHDRQDERARRARRDLHRMGEQTEKLLGAGRGESRDAPEDPIELWGRRIGRGLGYAIATGLLIYLLAAYVFV